MLGCNTQTSHSMAPRRLALGCMALALCLMGCKACFLPWTGWQPLRLLRWWARLATISASDLAFVCGLWALLRLALAACCRLRAPAVAFWFPASILLAAAVLLGVVNVPVFLILNVQLSYPLLSLAGTWRQFATSVVEATPWQAWIAAVTLPVLVPGIMSLPPIWPLALRRTGEGHPPAAVVRRTVRLAPLGWVALLLYLAGASWWCRTQWPQRSMWQRRAARSPHVQLLYSLAACGRSPWGELLREAKAVQAGIARPQAATVGNTTRPRPRFRNLLLVVLESVGSGYLQVYGAPWPNTPRLAALARHSLIFENAYAQCPSSAKALVALVTGTYPRLDLREQTREGEQLPSLAASAARRGYRTAFFHSGNWAWRGGDEFLRNHGFEHFQDARHEPSLDDSWGTRDAWLADQALRWIDSEQRPFLAMLWTIQTHHPYRCSGIPQPYAPHDAELNRYLNAIRDADALIGRLWDALNERSLADSTLLVVVGDHGQAFGQHQQRLHIFGLYEENVRVPLMLIHHGQLPTGRVGEVCQQIDIAPTVAWCLGLSADPRWQGRNLLVPARDEPVFFYTLWDPVVLGTRRGPYKYLWQAGGGEQLFDLAADALELHNLAWKQPELTRRLRRDVVELVASQQSQPAGRGRRAAAR